MKTRFRIGAATLGWVTMLVPAGVMAQTLAPGSSQSYPVRPIRLIVAVPPGGAADFTARIVGQKLAESLGQNVVIENRGGAGGTIASEMTSRATADGYTLLWSSVTTHGAGPMLYTRLPYDSIRDFTHIGLAASLPMIVVAHVSVPVKSVKELIELAKAKPNTLNFASSGSGSLPHLVGELFKSRTGAPITHVPYKGSGPAVVDLAAGNVQVMFDAVPSLIGQIKAGRLRVIGSVAAKRSELFPDAPTMAESGYSGIEGVIWYGVSGPAGIPKPVVARVNGELAKLLALPEVKERFGQQGAIPTPMTPEQYTSFIRAEQAKWGPVVKTTGAKAD